MRVVIMGGIEIAEGWKRTLSPNLELKRVTKEDRLASYLLQRSRESCG